MAATGDEHAASEILRGISRHLNCLNEDNKATRKRALESIKQQTVNKGLPKGVLQEVFSSLLKPLLKCLSDPMEKCRETTIATITEFIRCVPKPEESLPYLMPCLAQRFGDKEILEPSEELRLRLYCAAAIHSGFLFLISVSCSQSLSTVTHQHSRVRVSAIEATGAVIQHGSGKNLDDVVSHLAQRLFDDSPQVLLSLLSVF
ncbi:hypothetical protein GOODEAATRI_033152 [Goodea atripinnis]|uniref:Dynein axonemal assembly factor 5 TPR repeats domain-containing protein n=1 Tax=Goodea atripinnis TaxID=208336 RepID=A0ABV0PJ36_9TELE